MAYVCFEMDGAGNSHQYLDLNRVEKALDLSRVMERSIFDEIFIFYYNNRINKLLTRPISRKVDLNFRGPRGVRNGDA